MVYKSISQVISFSNELELICLHIDFAIVFYTVKWF